MGSASWKKRARALGSFRPSPQELMVSLGEADMETNMSNGAPTEIKAEWSLSSSIKLFISMNFRNKDRGRNVH